MIPGPYGLGHSPRTRETDTPQLLGRPPPRQRPDAAGLEQLVGPLAAYKHLAARVTTTGTMKIKSLT
ncbi:hypothetical protein ACFYT5_38740 [Streptomyces anulatus]|uniref:hypothetical protein n=1 Tax=Streptomyces anulatus TaxID=1892 RepID=UPI0036B545A6